MKAKRIAATLAATAALLAASMAADTAPVVAHHSGSGWGAWHDTTLRNGNHDRVRVLHQERGTLCDFERADRWDTRLISIDVNWRACVPTRDR